LSKIASTRVVNCAYVVPLYVARCFAKLAFYLFPSYFEYILLVIACMHLHSNVYCLWATCPWNANRTTRRQTNSRSVSVKQTDEQFVRLSGPSLR